MNSYLKKYNRCNFCKSKKLKKTKLKNNIENFYIKAIKHDLNLKRSVFDSMSIYECKNCGIMQYSPWFKPDVAYKIYNEIYSQHNRNWSNLLNYFKNRKLPNHGNLFKFIKKLKIQKYAEFNSPFMGLNLNFFDEKNIFNRNFLKKLFSSSIKYLNSRQMAGLSKKQILKKTSEAKKHLKLIKKFKNHNKKIKVRKYLLVKHSQMIWGQNDNYKSVNSRSLASFLFNINIIELDKKKKFQKFDLFGIFHTLDHTFEPNEVLNFALKNSKNVLVYCHIDKNLTKQHLFTFTKKFLDYLYSKKIYNLNLSNIINKKYKSDELYFICSKSKKNISKLNKIK